MKNSNSALGKPKYSDFAQNRACNLKTCSITLVMTKTCKILIMHNFCHDFFKIWTPVSQPVGCFEPQVGFTQINRLASWRPFTRSFRRPNWTEPIFDGGWGVRMVNRCKSFIDGQSRHTYLPTYGRA